MIAKFVQLLGGGVIGKVANWIRPNAEKSAQRESSAEEIRVRQYADEFDRANGSKWWDGLMDALNRIPRPAFAFWLISMLMLPMFNPSYALEVVLVYDAIPTDVWIALGILLSFYFGGRWKAQKHRETAQVEKVKAIGETLRSNRRRDAIGERFREGLGSDDLKPRVRDPNPALSALKSPSDQGGLMFWISKYKKRWLLAKENAARQERLKTAAEWEVKSLQQKLANANAEVWRMRELIKVKFASEKASDMAFAALFPRHLKGPSGSRDTYTTNDVRLALERQKQEELERTAGLGREDATV